MSQTLTVLMPFHTPFYAPLAAGVALGHFRDTGLDVTAVPAARFGKATMPALLDAVRAYATVGEMCDALRDVWGEYQEAVAL